MSGIRIAYLRTDELPDTAQEGGSYSHIRGFVDALLKAGHSVFFIASGYPAKIDPRRTPLYVIRFPEYFRTVPDPSQISYNYRFIARALRILRREKPDLIYQRHSSFNVCGFYLSRLLRIPYVLEVNSSQVWVQANWGRLFLKGLCRLFEDVAFLGADVLVVVSEVLKRDLVRIGIDSAKILVNPNGVDPSLFHRGVDGSQVRSRYGLEGKVVVGFLGTFRVWHGIPVLAEAIRAAVEKEPRLHFLLMGDGNLRSDFERRIQEEGVESSVTLAGLVPHREIPQYLAACEILVSPHVPLGDGSEFFGSPTKLFEYMAMGKGIVASDLGQIGEVLKDGESAILVKPGDSKGLTEGILRLASNEGLRERLGRRACEVVTAQYTWNRNAERVLELARRLLDRKG